MDIDCEPTLVYLKDLQTPITPSVFGVSHQQFCDAELLSSLLANRLGCIVSTRHGQTPSLAALVGLFPGVNFILLDSDCLPVTLFEAC